ncbi:alpha-L-fucosidase [Rhodohalobacter sulfatireducens]|uniref:alpha-L-fucosidase n=1 Tax=Rhodohalobacter sulfatireducens TaxID=2911366 RepID=A0ABS9K7X0_9BACT|nr:alpha-L-fucosidase [Rhodohalobacter sulfatireducens]MCG2586947.1 alpha-L-fucosidase [Rhodohalobacter sulfatireducens]
MKKIVQITLTLLFISTSVFAQASDDEKKYEPTWESLAEHDEAPGWFRDAKFGIYFHWGVYSVPAFNNEWYPRHMYAPDLEERGEETWGQDVYGFHTDKYGSPSEFSYPDFIPMFTAENFDPQEWASLFKEAGAQFAGPVAEHHDGFSMWDSEITPWNASDMGPKRDITGELAEAIRGHGMKFITSFHHARNNLWKPEGEEWTGHYSYVKEHFPSLLDDPERAILYGYMSREKFLEMWSDKLKEVIDKYQPDMMWFDSWLHEIPDSVQTDYLAYYFNKAGKWDKDVVVTRKQNDLPLSVSILDFEKGRAEGINEHPFLTDDTISKGSWCYTEGLGIKSTSIVLHSLIDIVSKNGQLLLNISPMADGTIPENQKQVLLEMGDWLEINGEAIYGSRPWKVYGEGPTQLQEGQFGGVTDAEGFTAEDVRYTRRGDTLYAIILGWPRANQEFQFDELNTESLDGKTISDISILGSSEEIDWDLSDESLSVQMPSETPDEKAIVFKIRTE